MFAFKFGPFDGSWDHGDCWGSVGSCGRPIVFLYFVGGSRVKHGRGPLSGHDTKQKQSGRDLIDVIKAYTISIEVKSNFMRYVLFYEI